MQQPRQRRDALVHVDDPDQLLPDTDLYTCLLRYISPAYLPESGRLLVRLRNDIANGGAPTQLRDVLECWLWTPDNRKWRAPELSDIAHVVCHSNIMQEAAGGESVFTHLLGLINCRDYYFMTVHRLYALDAGDAALAASSTCAEQCVANDDENVAAWWALRKCERQSRAARRRRIDCQGTLRPAHNLDEPIGSVVSVYMNDPKWAQLMSAPTLADPYMATCAAKLWREFTISTASSCVFSCTPPDTRSHRLPAVPLHARRRVGVVLPLYDAQQRTVSWMAERERAFECNDDGCAFAVPHDATAYMWSCRHANVDLVHGIDTPLIMRWDVLPDHLRRGLASASVWCQPPASMFESEVPAAATPTATLPTYGVTHNFTSLSWLPPSVLTPVDQFLFLASREQLWRARHATVAVRVQGGVLCDRTGTGKTVSTLALICERQLRDGVHARAQLRARSLLGGAYGTVPFYRLPARPDMARTRTHYYTPCTLVVCPKQLCEQWRTEVAKVCGGGGSSMVSGLRVAVVGSTADAAALSVHTVLHECDVIVMNLRVFQQQSYRDVAVCVPDTVMQRLGWSDATFGADMMACQQVSFTVLSASSGSGTAETHRRFVLRNSYADEDTLLQRAVRLNQQATAAAPDVAPVGSFFVGGFHAALFHFERVIVDEMHELDGQRYVERGLGQVRRDVTWGLTATPSFHAAETFGGGENAVQRGGGFASAALGSGYGAMLALDADAQAALARSVWNRWLFTQHVTRRSGSEALPLLVEHRVDVRMTAQEMAIYLSLEQQRRRHRQRMQRLLAVPLPRDDGGTINPYVRYGVHCLHMLVQFCAHHELGNAAWQRRHLSRHIRAEQHMLDEDDDDDDAHGTDLDSLLMESDNDNEHAHDDERVWQTSVHIDEMGEQLQSRRRERLTTVRAELEAYRAQKRHKNEAAAAALQREQQQLEAELSYYDTTLRLLSNTDDVDCPVCLRVVPPDATAVTVCGHVFCRPCLREWMTSSSETFYTTEPAFRDTDTLHYKCPHCRRVLDLRTDLKVIDRTHVADVGTHCSASGGAAATTTTQNDGHDERPTSSYGSKIDELLRLLQQIEQQQQPSADERRSNSNKVVVFAQFDHLLQLIGEALRDGGVPSVSITGSQRTCATSIERFRRDPSVRVMLLSCQRRGGRETISGLNLCEAQHLIFVHPLLGSDEFCHARAEQARGRIRRYGQRHTCHVWHLVAKGTVEEQLYERNERYTRERSARDGPVGGNRV